MKYETALRVLRCVRAQTDRILVYFSGGKDSLCTLDLCVRVFPQVEACYFYRVPGMKITQDLLTPVRKRYDIVIHEIQANDVATVLRDGILSPPRPIKETPDGLRTLMAARSLLWSARGIRASDSLARRGILRQGGAINLHSHQVYPLAWWNREEVLDYLRVRRLPRPPTFGRQEQGGVDFHPDTYEFLRTRYPEDWSKWLEVFPYAEAVRFAAYPNNRRSAGITPPSPA